jgi:hypothetical protein
MGPVIMFYRRVFALILTLLCLQAKAEIAVIVNSRVEINSLSLAEAKQIFVGKSRIFPNGASAIPVLNMNESINEEFIVTVTGKTPNQFEAGWNVFQFTGKGQIPQEFANDEQVKDWIASHDNCIGYIDMRSFVSEERRIKTVLKLANNP